MAYENNWRNKTIENLEKDFWRLPDPETSTGLVVRCHKLRKITLDQFTIEDLRLMIGQHIGLFYLMPLAIKELQKDIFAEGDYYPGDLLNAILNIDASFWQQNAALWQEVDTLIANNRTQITVKKISFIKFDTAIQKT